MIITNFKNKSMIKTLNLKKCNPKSSIYKNRLIKKS